MPWCPNDFSLLKLENVERSHVKHWVSVGCSRACVSGLITLNSSNNFSPESLVSEHIW